MMNKRETELFLQAFEKPTQMYRYLREHHLFSPVFLHRNLSYLSDRMSRSNAKRKITNVDAVCEALAAKKLALDTNEPPASLRMELFSFFDKNRPAEMITQVEFIAKNSQIDSKKRQQTKVLDTIFLSENMDNGFVNSDQATVVNLTMAELKYSMINGNTAIKIRTSFVPKQHRTKRQQHRTKAINVLRDRCKYAGAIYETDLIVMDQTGKFVLIEGEYELKLNDRCVANDEGYKNLRWQELPRLYTDNKCSEYPKLKFRLVWSRTEQLKHIRNNHLTQDCNGNVRSRNANNVLRQQRNGDTGDSSSDGEMCISVSSASSSGHGTMTDKCTKLKNNQASVRLYDCMSRIIYRFIYNKNMSQQTETYDNYNCPWCKLNCIRLDSLMVHLRLTHDHFQFEFTPTPQAVIIDVTIRKHRNGTMRRERCARKAKTVVVYYRSKGDKKMSAATAFAIGDNMMMEIGQNADDKGMRFNGQNVVSFADGHNRLYYRSQTCMPMYTTDEFDVDSEGEPDPTWLRDNCKILLDEFTDVNEGEKELMNMWNAHIMQQNYVGDVQMVDACENFIHQSGGELIRKHLYRNFLLHLTNLYDFGLITCGTVHQMASQLQQMSHQYMCS